MHDDAIFVVSQRSENAKKKLQQKTSAQNLEDDVQTLEKNTAEPKVKPPSIWRIRELEYEGKCLCDDGANQRIVDRIIARDWVMAKREAQVQQLLFETVKITVDLNVDDPRFAFTAQIQKHNWLFCWSSS
jgi:hypothetical protein